MTRIVKIIIIIFLNENHIVLLIINLLLLLLSILFYILCNIIVHDAKRPWQGQRPDLKQTRLTAIVTTTTATYIRLKKNK